MIKKGPINNFRIRQIRQCTFGWIDHNFLHHGYVNYLSHESLLLYFFLCLVADRNGCSYYDYDKICRYLKISLDQLLDARKQLIQESLIDFQDPVYQVVSLVAPKKEQQKLEHVPSRQDQISGFQQLKKILEHVKEQ